MERRWSIEIAKDYLKFSAAHFLIFPDGSAERLHGHNYKVYVDVNTRLDEHGLVLNFIEIKPLIRQLCDELDEHLLIPGEHPELRCEARDDGLSEIRYRERYYLIPTGEIIVLPISNSSAENLAGWFADQLVERIRTNFDAIDLLQLVVGVEETPGQRGVVTLDFS